MTIKMTDPSEIDFFEKICAFSKKDKETVRDVLKAILLTTTACAYSDIKDVYIPYVAKFSIDYKDIIKTDKNGKSWSTTDVKINAEPMQALINEITAINEGEEPESFSDNKNSITLKIYEILDVYEGVDEE